ncbi:MAG: ABC transporter permease [Methylobacteriaceae bacterium]|nr:ABC transporter permease [Methylobacteriaceae bacterium]
MSTSGSAARSPPERWSPLAGLRAPLSRNAMVVAAVVLFGAFAVTSNAFATLGNVENILKQAAAVLLLGLGVMLVVLVGGIDLSVGSVVLASATAAGIALTEHLGAAIAIAAAIGVGALVGFVNALLVEGLSISPVIVTLGSMIAVRGLGLVALGQYRSWIDIDDPLFNALAQNAVLGLPAAAALALAIAALCALILRRTILGRRLYAVGDHAASARLCGVPVRLLRGLAYVACGALAGLAGVVTAARTGVISPSIGVGLEFYAIAVVALGAGGLPAGRVQVGQTVVGALILMMVFNYMTIRGIAGTWQTTATGFLLLGAIVVGRLVQGVPDDSAVGIGLVEEVGLGRLRASLSRNAIAAATILLALVFALINPRFATLPNAVALLEQNAAFAIVAVGAMIGIVSRSIDISSGSVVALGAVGAALAAKFGALGPLALCAGIALCLIAYAVNGILVGALDLDPLIVTLAAWIWARGLAVSLTGAQTIAFDPSFVAFMNTPLAIGLTPAVVLIGLAFGLGWIILARLPIGIRLYAIGNDPRMLRQAGVSTSRVRMIAFLLMGAFTAAGMVVMLGRLGAAAPTAGFGLELDAIVAVIIGGTSFRGGEGRLRDTAVGVAFLAVLSNGLSGLQMGDAEFFLIKGGAILAALTLRSLSRSFPARRPRRALSIHDSKTKARP